MRRTRPVLWMTLLLGACGGATVDGSSPDVAASQQPDASADVVALDAGTPPPVDATVDAGTGDRQLPGDLSPLQDVAPLVPPGAPYVVDLAVHEQLHQCALMSDGTVRCRGYNDYGQLGIGPTERAVVDEARTVSGLDGVEQVVTSSGYTTCARRRDGSVWCWGRQAGNMLGIGSAGAERCGRPEAFREFCRTRPTRLTGVDEVVWLAVADFAVCAVRRDGSVWCWGSTNMLLPRGGAATPVRAPGLMDVETLWPRRFGWVVRHRDGSYTTVGIIPPAPVIPDGVELASGGSIGHVCYRLPDATMRCLGLNAHGKLGNGASVWPGDVDTPVDPGLTGVRSVATGEYQTCAVRDDDSLWCWGSGEYGGLGYEATEGCAGITEPTRCATRPQRVPGIDRVRRAFLGVWGGCAQRFDHSVWCWGTLGNPRYSPMPTPIVW